MGSIGAGVFVIGLGIHQFYITYVLSKTKAVEEKAVITAIHWPARSIDFSIYFRIRNEYHSYRKHFVKLTAFNAKIGDCIDIMFSDNRKHFIIKQYISASFISDMVQIVLGVCLFCFSFIVLNPILSGLNSRNRSTGSSTFWS
jgi:hypothetical protein